MTKTFWKNIRRSVTGSLGRYLAILLIILLGVAFLTGLRLTRPVMTVTAEKYIDDAALYDLRLLSTIGFDSADVEVSAVSGVTAAEGAANTDFISLRGDEEHIYRAHMLTDSINRPVLTAGSMPTRGDECLADAGRFTEDMIGQKITVSETGEDDILAYREYTITGLARSPLYISIERGISSLGSGSLEAFVLIPPEGFDTEYFTELYVKCSGDFELYSDEYEDFVDSVSDAVENSAAASV